MRSVALAALVAMWWVPQAARAETPEQDNQVLSGVMGAYVPPQNNSPNGIAAVGSYVAYAHDIGLVHLGMRLALLYGWAPSGATGQQYIIEPDLFIGVHARLGKPFSLRAELGTGPLVNGGESQGAQPFPTTIIDHTYVRLSLQWTIVKSVMVEVFGGPAFVISPYTVAVFPELGLGGGWSF